MPNLIWKVTKDEFAELFLMINYCESIGDKLLGNEICFSVIYWDNR